MKSNELADFFEVIFQELGTIAMDQEIQTVLEEVTAEVTTEIVEGECA